MSARGVWVACLWLAIAVMAPQPAQAQQGSGSGLIDLTPDGDAWTEPAGRQGSPSPWPDEAEDPLDGLGIEGLAPPPVASPQQSNDQSLDDLKSLLREIDPRGGLDLDLPVTLEADSITDRPPTRGTSDDYGASDFGDGYAGGAAGSAGSGGATRQSSGTIGEMSQLIAEVFSDFRIYIYLMLALGAVLSAFAIAAVVRWSRARSDRRRARRRHGRGRHARSRKSHSPSGSQASRRRRRSRRLAHS